MSEQNADLPLLEQLAFITTRIECDLSSGKKSSGTGFFFRFDDREKALNSCFLITNRHVVEGASRVTVFFTSATPDGRHPVVGEHFKRIIADGEESWVHHPDATVDLSALCLNAEIERGNATGPRLFLKTFDETFLLQSHELASVTAGRDIMMIGYPNALWDTKHNMPIFRRGITATHVGIDFDGRREFMIDAACFPGSSGSPVILYDPGIKAGPGLKGGGPVVKLLGVLWGGPKYTVEGSIKAVPVPTQVVPVAESSMLMNLGYVIRAERILDFRPTLEAMNPNG